jgi:hypothetical protein
MGFTVTLRVCLQVVEITRARAELRRPPPGSRARLAHARGGHECGLDRKLMSLPDKIKSHRRVHRVRARLYCGIGAENLQLCLPPHTIDLRQGRRNACRAAPDDWRSRL